MRHYWRLKPPFVFPPRTEVTGIPNYRVSFLEVVAKCEADGYTELYWDSQTKEWRAFPPDAVMSVPVKVRPNAFLRRHRP